CRKRMSRAGSKAKHKNISSQSDTTDVTIGRDQSTWTKYAPSSPPTKTPRSKKYPTKTLAQQQAFLQQQYVISCCASACRAVTGASPTSRATRSRRPCLRQSLLLACLRRT